MAHLGLSSVGEPVCIRTKPSRKFAIHVHPDILWRLGRDSRLAFKIAPCRGPEIGGILLGHAESQDDAMHFWIEGFERVESEQRSGPSAVSTEADIARLQETLTKNGTKSIGIYRSQTHSERSALLEPNVDLFERCFEARDALFLLLSPVPGIAAFFTREDGSLKCVHEVALAPSRSSVTMLRQGLTSPQVRSHSLPHRELHNTVSSAVTRSESPEKEAQGTAAHPKFGPNVKKRWLGLAAVIATLVLSVSGLAYFFHRSLPPEKRAPQSLRLNVERAGPSLRLVWDRNSSIMRTATRAVVHIDDGDHRSYRDLAPSEFSEGSLTYEPRSSEVTFRLDVYSAKPNASGSILAINLSPQSTLAQAPFRQAALKLAVQPSPARTEALLSK
jgi:hypothetical protein